MVRAVLVLGLIACRGRQPGDAAARRPADAPRDAAIDAPVDAPSDASPDAAVVRRVPPPVPDTNATSRTQCVADCKRRNMYTDCADAEGHMLPCPCHCP